MSRLTRLRASPEDRAIVASPPLRQWPALLAQPDGDIGRPEPDILGRVWSELHAHARQTALAAAQSYLAEKGEPLPSIRPDRLILAGHQPDLFHPGVWVKNFALNGLARQVQATPLNLVIDNDTTKANTLRVPAGRHLGYLPFDAWQGEVTYEELAVADEAWLASLPRRVAEACPDWGFSALLPDFWAEVGRLKSQTPLLGERLAAVRRRWERAWGCHNLEVPLSRLCQTEPFAWFACHLLRQLPRFHWLYNRVVQDYRAAQRLRSHNHPVPDLSEDGDWLEAPLWAWRAGHKRRGRLFVRVTTSALHLRCDAEPWPTLEGNEHSAEQLVAQWQDLERRGYKVRTRALTTTLYARLFLGDLFIHGIGGGIYDVLTDELIRHFYEVAPPVFVILSATLLLPLPRFQATVAGQRQLEHWLRDLQWNPQRYLHDQSPLSATTKQLAQAKQTWIALPPSTAVQRRERFLHLQNLTQQLRPFLAEKIQQVQSRLEECQAELQWNAVAKRRDFAFVLYPESLLRPFCQQFLTCFAADEGSG